MILARKPTIIGKRSLSIETIFDPTRCQEYHATIVRTSVVSVIFLDYLSVLKYTSRRKYSNCENTKSKVIQVLRGQVSV